MGNIVAIVGRPNVGKSTFFNRLTESRHAIVDETSGVTRDRHYGKVIWNGRNFSVIDTGGYIKNSEDIFEEEIRKQVMLAIEEADVILLMVDVVNGITDLDESIAQMLRKVKKPVMLVANKADNNARLMDIPEFYKLGLGEIYPVSSINGAGTGDLLDDLVNHFEKDDTEDEESELPRIAVVGRPNVGKSSLINALIGEERNIVTEISGTTRDAINTRYSKFNHDFILVDTAGIRKKAKVKEDLEFYSVMRSVRTIENADVCMLMIDATIGIESQDVNIFHLIERSKKGVVVLINKWDLVEKETGTVKEYESGVRKKLEPFTDIPVVFISALTRQRIHKALEEAIKVFENRKRKIPTSKLNEVMQAAIEAYHPPAIKGKYIRIKYVTQLPTYTPAFAFYCNLPQYVKEPYKRYLENKIRENFDFRGAPVQIFMRKK
ncbi:MAG: ribosome biogenesis GTPase Der [Bacteroidales bacterium]|nr:ribosome biogenesis GTPase Der [Bacteroidales bacterium]MDT8431835.1 ribosome biogenesis GTPase Der [Bacteroidales bacterium]